MIERLLLFQQSKSLFTTGESLQEACTNDVDLKKEIESLALYFFKRTVSGCRNCYMDAYLELINLNTDKIMTQEESKFKLRHGVLLRDTVNHDISLNATVHNLTDELALYHLSTNPDSREYFEELPDNVDELVEKYIEEKETSGKELKNEEAFELLMKTEDISTLDYKEKKNLIKALEIEVENKKDETLLKALEYFKELNK